MDQLDVRKSLAQYTDVDLDLRSVVVLLIFRAPLGLEFWRGDARGL